MGAKSIAVPGSIQQLQGQFEQFRSTRPGRTKLPEALWQAAVEQARHYGVNVVAHTLRLDYSALKRRLNGASRPEQGTVPAAFVELVRSAGVEADECVVEFESGAGPRMRVRWRGSTPEWSSLLRAWREVVG